MLCRSDDGTVLDATGGAGLWQIVHGGIAAGTLTLAGEAAEANTKTDNFNFEFVLPPEYLADQDVKVIVNAMYVNTGTATATTKTIDVVVYEMADDGTAAAILTTAAQAVTTSFADYTFVVPDTTLSAGDRLMVCVQGVATEGGAGGGKTIQLFVGGVRVQCDIKG